MFAPEPAARGAASAPQPTQTRPESRPPVSDEELADMAAEMLGEMVRHGLSGHGRRSLAGADDKGDRYLLPRHHGQTSAADRAPRRNLAAIQYLVRLMVNQRIKRWKNIVVDVEAIQRAARHPTDPARPAHGRPGRHVRPRRVAGADARQRAPHRPLGPARPPDASTPKARAKATAARSTSCPGTPTSRSHRRPRGADTHTRAWH